MALNHGMKHIGAFEREVMQSPCKNSMVSGLWIDFSKKKKTVSVQSYMHYVFWKKEKEKAGDSLLTGYGFPGEQ